MTQQMFDLLSSISLNSDSLCVRSADNERRDDDVDFFAFLLRGRSSVDDL